MFPVEEAGDNEPVLSGDKPAAAVDPKRPAFSLPLMTQNFRRFNARYFPNTTKKMMRERTHTDTAQNRHSILPPEPNRASTQLAQSVPYHLLPRRLLLRLSRSTYPRDSSYCCDSCLCHGACLPRPPSSASLLIHVQHYSLLFLRRPCASSSKDD